MIGFNTEIFPAFFTNNSGIPSPMNVSDPKIIADMLLSQLKLGLNNGMNYVLCTRPAACVCVYECMCVRMSSSLYLLKHKCAHVWICIWYQKINTKLLM